MTEHQESQPQIRVTGCTYSGDATPLAEVLVMLYDWSIERRRRLATEKSIASREPTDACPRPKPTNQQ